MALKINPYRLLIKLSESYRRAWRGEDFPVSSREKELEEALKGVIDDYVAGRTILISEEDNVFECSYQFPISSEDMCTEEENSQPFSDPVGPDSLGSGSSSSSFNPSQDQINKEFPSWEKVVEVVEFWRSTKPHPIKKAKAALDFHTVQKKFSFVKNLNQLYRWERRILENDAPREWKLAQLASKVREKFTYQRDMQQPVHDSDLMRWSLTEAKLLNFSEFKCSKFWMWSFKKASRISRRKVTKFVSRLMVQDNENLIARAEQFVLNVKAVIEEFGPENVYNMDQSGFEKCMISRSTLAETGSTSVKVVAQSVSGTTHTYTVQPIISASGRLVTPVTVCLQEVHGEFGKFVKSSMFSSPSLIYPVASKSGKMGKEHLQDWFLNVMLPAGGTKFALIVDSYSAHKCLLDLVPEGCNVKILSIPAGATGMIQPLDVHGFRYWKDLARHFNKEAMRSDENVEMYTRNSILRMQALIVHLLSSTELTNFWQYSWAKCGYIPDEIKEHSSPMKACVGDVTKCCSLCPNLRCIFCPRCEKSLCFQHCFVETHLNCNH